VAPPARPASFSDRVIVGSGDDTVARADVKSRKSEQRRAATLRGLTSPARLDQRPAPRGVTLALFLRPVSGLRSLPADEGPTELTSPDGEILLPGAHAPVTPSPRRSPNSRRPRRLGQGRPPERGTDAISQHGRPAP